MAKTYTEKEITNIMRSIGCSREDAIDVWESDHEIDSGKDAWYEDPNDKQKFKEAVKAAHKGETKSPEKKSTPITFKTRERKQNSEKQQIISEIARFLGETPGINAENIAISNAEREISFTIGENSFSITLTQHRKPKN